MWRDNRVICDNGTVSEFVYRCDFGLMTNKPKVTNQGFRRIPASLTRTGILIYKRADGEISRELKVEDEVFDAESIETLHSAPVTDLHPGEFVNTENASRFLKGVVIDDTVKPNGNLLSGNLLITDAKLINLIDEGQRREVSPGYHVVVDHTPGDWNGLRYDAIHRKIKYNHIAIGPSGWGRSGSDVSLRADSDAYNITQQEFDARPIIIGVGAELKKEQTKNMETIKHNEKEFEVNKGVAEAFNKMKDEKDAQISELQSTQIEATKELENLRANLDEAKATVTDLEKKSDPAVIKAFVDLRFATLNDAKKISDIDYAKFDSSSQIKRAALAERGVEGLEDKSDDYVDARFDAVLENIGAEASKIEKAKEDLVDTAKASDTKVVVVDAFAELNKQAAELLEGA